MLLVCGALLLSFPVAAAAAPGDPGLDSAADGVYPTPGGQTLGALESGGGGGTPSNTSVSSPATASGGGSLPFTGLSALLVLAVAVTLMSLGGVVRILARRPNRA